MFNSHLDSFIVPQKINHNKLKTCYMVRDGITKNTDLKEELTLSSHWVVGNTTILQQINKQKKSEPYIRDDVEQHVEGLNIPGCC